METPRPARPFRLLLIAAGLQIAATPEKLSRKAYGGRDGKTRRLLAWHVPAPGSSDRGQASERAALLCCSKCVPRRDQRTAAWRRCSRRRTRPWMPWILHEPVPQVKGHVYHMYLYVTRHHDISLIDRDPVYQA
jgi:hypothetical protein